MKYIDKNIIDVDDFFNLESISEPSNSHRHLNIIYGNKEHLKYLYINYIFFAQKYRLMDLPRSSRVKNIGKSSFIEHYNNQKYFSDFILDFRRDNRTGFCYMCGALNAGTLDHLLPKDEYPEFSFFSKNLIPSCDCNLKKNETISSGLNPHFYKECESELFWLDISLNGMINNQVSYEYEIKVKNGFNENFEKILEFHLKNHILKFSDINNYINKRCASILNNPIAALAIRCKVSKSGLKEKVLDFYHAAKYEASSPNRWDVILYKGLLKKSIFDFIFSEVCKTYP
ncbi:hypothetical protein QSV37_05670 [Acinetobacter sp. VNK23]|uniref:hypothetical protein n=1 Tax=Acinetobacter thutiue TaxID=2998078 RepID=UPI002578E715|nr:hypothetical protein [Acinetobacter thutiue]MDM1019800.1 hypothetical protein [Acinetobacter thutiue]